MLLPCMLEEKASLPSLETAASCGFWPTGMEATTLPLAGLTIAMALSPLLRTMSAGEGVGSAAARTDARIRSDIGIMAAPSIRSGDPLPYDPPPGNPRGLSWIRGGGRAGPAKPAAMSDHRDRSGAPRDRLRA